ncbi:MAG: serine--tRNA ligase [Hyphomicrobiales bacterium]|nr:serine--tRNA ligase [Hyphomicrobiales bacterium]
MHDIRWIRENPAAFDKGLASRGLPPAAEHLIAIDEERRAAIGAAQAAQERRNALSKEIGQAKGRKDEARAQALIDEVAGLRESIITCEAHERAATKQLNEALAGIPNLPDPDVPVGEDELSNMECRRHGAPRGINSAKQHFELGETLGLMDFSTAAKLSGARFVVLRKSLARLARAIGQFMLDLHTTEHGYSEIQPPLLVKDEVMFGTGQLPKFADDQFTASRTKTREELLHEALEFVSEIDKARYVNGAITLQQLVDRAVHKAPVKEDFWLIPTAEVPLTNLVREAITPEAELPLRFTALTPCFRAEAGAAGRDTRGMLRQHQFDKVELVSITTPETSCDELERMLSCAEEVLKRLDLHYRVMILCTGDMGFSARKTYDIEVWLPGQGAFREISSCSVCGDFQARRMNARYRPAPADGKPASPRLVHTLNGSGVAVGRALIAVMETYQNPDSSIEVPAVLQPYMGGLKRIEQAG